MLRIANLEAGYGSLRVIKGVSLHVSPGEVVAIIGPNGAGKTTLLASIAGLIKPWTGEISLQGKRIEQAPPERIVALGCSLVPEGRQVFGSLTVRENLLLGGYVRRRERDAAPALEGIYRLFGVLRERERQLAATLSGGEQQMLAIGRALMARPRLLMMDEPSLGIAPQVAQMIFRTITELRAAGMTVLLDRAERPQRAAHRRPRLCPRDRPDRLRGVRAGTPR